MTTKTTMARRSVLRGILATGGTALIPLPLLEIMLNDHGTALAQTNAPVKSPYVTWFFGNGSLPGRWKPAATGSGAAWTLSPQLQPLSAFKSYLTVISGLENKLVVGGVEHPTGSAGATTGAPLNGNAVRAPSIDQLLALTLSTGLPFRSLEVGVTPATPAGPQDSLQTVSHRGPSARNNAEYDPKAIFNRLFTSGARALAGGGASMDQAIKTAAVRKSVLDACLEDGAALQKKLGASDRRRMQDHLDAIRAIEARLQTSGGGRSVDTSAVH